MSGTHRETLTIGVPDGPGIRTKALVSRIFSFFFSVSPFSNSCDLSSNHRSSELGPTQDVDCPLSFHLRPLRTNLPTGGFPEFSFRKES